LDKLENFIFTDVFGMAKTTSSRSTAWSHSHRASPTRSPESRLVAREFVSRVVRTRGMADTTPTGQVAVENDRVHPESIKIIAQQVGIESLPDEVARALAPDVEYRLREVIQDAMKFAKHSKRRVITTEDVNASLRLRDVDPLYGFPAGAGPVAFKEVPGHAELFFTDEKELTLKDVLAARLPRPPVAVNVVPHWLAVDGVQPVIPENPNPLTSRDAKRGVVAFENGPSDVNKHNTQHKPFRTPLAPDEVPALGGAASHRAQTNGTGTGTGTEGLGNCPYVVEPTLAHELSAELQLYFDRVTSTIRGGGEGSESLVLRAALESMETDNGLHQLVPYFVQFAQTEVATSLKNVPRLNAVIAAIKALSSNKHLNLELYLHQLMPVVVTCMVAKRIGNRGGGDDSGGILTDGDDHWQLRERAAATISLVCRRFGERYPTIQPRITCVFPI
jgi:transcription initiation factor TFIID subunit 6|tara:strand:+ start:3103 stop:4443 length:1341 start_codon:yes stop_codon:yes gene_type:complete